MSLFYDNFLVGFVPPPSFEPVHCYICGCRRVAFARYWMICLVPVNENHFSSLLISNICTFGDSWPKRIYTALMDKIFHNIGDCLHQCKKTKQLFSVL